MGDELLKISLNQGKKFNNYQSKIKRKIRTSTREFGKGGLEGFVSSEEPNGPIDFDSLTKLQQQFDDLLIQYESIRKSATETAQSNINRLSPANPLLGKNIQFANGKICYVTYRGIAKPYMNADDFSATAGKNGCPRNDIIVKLDIQWLTSYVVGSTLPTNPPLIVGSNMVPGESCGLEGKNIVASSLVGNPESEYVGCFNTGSNTDAINTSFEECQNYALANGYPYFGYQQVEGTDQGSQGKCSVFKDISSLSDGTNQVQLMPIWASNTTIGTEGGTSTGPNTCYITMDGKLGVFSSDGTAVWQSPNTVTECSFGGYVNPDTIQGSYGGNCVGKPLNIDCGNPSSSESYGTTGIVNNLNALLKDEATKQLSNKQNSWSFNPVSNWTGEDPAFCCAKLVDYSYQCGGSAFKSGQISAGSNILFDCSDTVSNCSFFLVLRNDGVLALTKGLGTDSSSDVWTTGTSQQQKSKNPEWVSSKGKYGRNYLKQGEVLIADEWIGSDDGSTKLIMQSDGNLVLYTSVLSMGCINEVTSGIKQNNRMVGQSNTTTSVNTNAIYKLNALGNRASLGKIGYIDAESKLKEYPQSMLSLTNSYKIYPNTDLINEGANISSLVASDENACQTACNSLTDCYGYTYDTTVSNCWLKNGSIKDSSTTMTPTTGVHTGVRTMKPVVPKSCGSQMVEVNTLQYDNYQRGEDMTAETECNKTISQKDTVKLDNIKSQLTMLGQEISAKMVQLYSQDSKIYEKMGTNARKFEEDLAKYKDINRRIKEQSIIEGMHNKYKGANKYKYEPFTNINDVNGMLTDTNLRVLQENYTYFLWTILAIGILTITIRAMK